MQLVIDGDLYKIAKITGPTHNMLGLSFFQENETGQLNIDDLEIKKSSHNTLNKNNIIEIVTSTIEEFNSEFKVNLRIKTIQFLSSDTPIINCYKELTTQIALKFINSKHYK